MMLKDLIIWTILMIILVVTMFMSMRLYKKNAKENTTKKKILFSIPTLVYCFVVVLVVLLFSDSKLNHIEKQVYDRVTSMINEDGFFNPKEARLLDVVVKYEYSDIDRKYSDTIDTYYIKVIGTNKVGGTINKCYEIYYSDYRQKWNNYSESCGDIYKSGNGYEQLSSNSIKNINKALKKYWDNLGL